MKPKVFKVMKHTIMFLFVFFSLSTTWNFICKSVETKKIEGAYGDKINVNGREMVVSIAGKENSSTIILLPGLGSASPVLEFKPLAQQLSEKYRVITVEPFGYGLSDGTDKERTVYNIVDELHKCVKQLGCSEYYLMGHSIAGIYSLYWANQYAEEVQGFIGIDSSVPKMEDEEPFPVSMVTLNRMSTYLNKTMNTSGITRLKSIGNPQKAIYADSRYPYTKDEIKTFRILSMNASGNRTVIDEINQTEVNLKTVRDMKFPQDIPVLEFISSDNCKMMSTWEKLHKEVIQSDGKGQVIRLQGGHYLHFEQREEIVKDVKAWIK